MRTRLRLLLLGLPLATNLTPRWLHRTLAQPAPDDAFVHPEWFADPAWVREHLDDEQVVVVALTPANEFAAGHIPGAAQVDWPAFEIVDTSEAMIAEWQAGVEATLTELGIERGDTVVVYDGGTFYAARLWWMLHQLGHEDVRIVNGGLVAWREAGEELEAGPGTVAPASEPYAGTPDEAALIPVAAVEEAFAQDAAVFLDVRSPEEYAAGHIPGAVNVPFLENAVAERPPFWKPAAELRAMYEAVGVTPDQQVIVYCTTGVRAAVTYFTLRQLDYAEVAVFTGSFAEWSSDPDRPVETGAD